jgi:hypothetical protein
METVIEVVQKWGVSRAELLESVKSLILQANRILLTSFSKLFALTLPFGGKAECRSER